MMFLVISAARSGAAIIPILSFSRSIICIVTSYFQLIRYVVRSLVLFCPYLHLECHNNRLSSDWYLLFAVFYLHLHSLFQWIQQVFLGMYLTLLAGRNNLKALPQPLSVSP